VDESLTPTTQELNCRLRSVLETSFPRETPLSVLLLHISQFEHVQTSPQAATLYKRLCYHAPTSFLEQVLVNVRRAIRANDQILVHAGIGAAIIFPDTDRHGMAGILERVYQNIRLLQAETAIPPLRRETDILLGIGSYPEPGLSLERLLYHAGLVARRFTLRPAISTQLCSVESVLPTPARTPKRAYPHPEGEAQTSKQQVAHRQRGIPFMQLPTQIPRRLKQLIPYEFALATHCAPVGRDHNRLTLAMADPTDKNILRQVKELTGMIIFPVLCEPEALAALLAQEW